MEHVRVVNLRCIADSSRIAIKPLSVLVGANSSGKSTFLRIFPLLQQSHEVQTLGGLILDEGDADFGFFNEALHKGASPPELKLEFGFTAEHMYYRGVPWNHFLMHPMEIVCELIYVERKNNQHYPRLSAINLTLASGDELDHICITADEGGGITEFKINDFNVPPTSLESLRLRMGKGLIPGLVFLSRQQGIDATFDIAERTANIFDEMLLHKTSSLFHGKTGIDTRLFMLQSIGIGSAAHMLSFMKTHGSPKWKQRVSVWLSGSATFREVRNLILARRAQDLLESVNIYVTQLAKSVHYFQPVRATAKRTYQSRDVSVTSVDSSGLNVAMVLASLSRAEQQRFREWMRTYFPFEVYPQGVGDGARVELRIRDTVSGLEFNLADAGFGFSQMLPFLVQVWSLLEGQSAKDRYRYLGFWSQRPVPIGEGFIVAIEQPELHLHPALQAQLADLIVAMVSLSKKRYIPLRFFLETHSQTIIERIGQSVEAKLLAEEDVQVILFEADKSRPKSNTSTVKTTTFDSCGVLKDWPFGFLSAPLTIPVSKESGA